MGGYIDLLVSLPKSKRDVRSRAASKDPEVISVAKEFGKEYFDGERKYGYGGFKYDGRYLSVARDIIKFFNLGMGSKILDIGCAKGFLVHDLLTEGRAFDVFGLDVSEYALTNCMPEVEHRLYQGNALHLPFPDKSFDLVVSINTLHNLPREKLVKALQEIERVSCGKSYIVVDSYYSHEQKIEFENWALTAEYHAYPHEWISLFKEAGYTGHYSWNVL